jgi:hypothetical protein
VTIGTLRKLVRKWQKILTPMGVGHWDVRSLEIVESEEFLARASCSTQYDQVYFQFAKDYLEEAPTDRIEKTIIHEWLHVAWRDYEQVEVDAREQFAPVVEDLMKSRFDHEREGLIQRLAETIFVVHSRSNAT